MNELKLNDGSILYCLENLAGYEPEDIDCDDVDIAVNDDQFSSMSIVGTARLAADLVSRQNEELQHLRKERDELVDALTESNKAFQVNLSKYCYKDENAMSNSFTKNKELLHKLNPRLRTKER